MKRAFEAIGIDWRLGQSVERVDAGQDESFAVHLSGGRCIPATLL